VYEDFGLFTADPEIDATEIEIAVQNGEVTLEGTVPDRRMKRDAEDCVESSFGVRENDVERTYSPRSDVTIVRDRSFGVPHVYGTTRDGAMFGLGYVGAEDRLFFMDILRHAGRAELSSFAGGANAAMDAEQWEVAPYTEADLQMQVDRAEEFYGAAGREELAERVLAARRDTEAGDRAQQLERHVRANYGCGLQQTPRHCALAKALAVTLGDKPELLWDHPRLEGLNALLEDEFEIRERLDALDRKVELAARTERTLVDLMSTRHALRRNNSANAISRLGANGASSRNRFAGKCVKTMVFTRPMRWG